MATHRALVLSSLDKPLSLETVPRPIAKAGEAVVRVLALAIVPYMSEILNGSRPYPLSLPLTPGSTAIGRVEQVGPDAVGLTPGQLVFCDVTIRGRDDPSVTILFGVHGGGYPAAQKLMEGEWRNATFAEYAKFPLENLFALKEDVLLKTRGYSIADLCSFPSCLVPFGGMSDIGVAPGDVVIVAPATGRYGGAAVTVALAMGASVIAAGRNTAALDSLSAVFASTGRLTAVTLTGDPRTDTDALKRARQTPRAQTLTSISVPRPRAAPRSSPRCSPRCVPLGDARSWEIMFKSLRLQGRFMYDRAHIVQLIKMIEAGNLKLGKEAGVTRVQSFGLESIEEGLKAAGTTKGWAEQVLLMP